MNGKGDKRRPVDANKFVDNYNNIFGEKKMNKDKIHEKLVMYWDTYQAMGKNRPDEEHELRDRFFHYLVGLTAPYSKAYSRRCSKLVIKHPPAVTQAFTVPLAVLTVSVAAVLLITSVAAVVGVIYKLFS